MGKLTALWDKFIALYKSIVKFSSTSTRNLMIALIAAIMAVVALILFVKFVAPMLVLGGLLWWVYAPAPAPKSQTQFQITNIQKYGIFTAGLFSVLPHNATVLGIHPPTTIADLCVKNPIISTAAGLDLMSAKMLKSVFALWTPLEGQRKAIILQNLVESAYNGGQMMISVYDCVPNGWPVVVLELVDEGSYVYVNAIWDDGSAAVQQFLITHAQRINQWSAPSQPAQLPPQQSQEIPLVHDLIAWRTGKKLVVYWPYQSCPHGLIVGATGSGKSVAGQVWLVRMVQNIPKISLWILDFKGQDYSFLSGKSHYFPYDMVSQGLHEFYHKVFETRQSGATSCATRVCLVIEELAAFLNSLEKKEAEEAKRLLANMLMLGRSFGVHILCTVQRADAEYFGKSRDNFTAVLGLGTMSKEQKQMLFAGHTDEMKESCGQGQGYLLVDGRDICSVQVPIVASEVFAKLHCTIAKAVE